MGWNSWNTFGKEANESVRQSEGILQSGLRAVSGGYVLRIGYERRDPLKTLQDLSAEEKLRLICAKDLWKTEDLEGEVPSLVVSDGPVGVRKVAVDENGKQYDLPSVAYPAIQCLANSWNEALARSMGEALADDCLEKQVDILLAPGVNIKRSPLNGRNFEYFSEDPYLAGTLAREYIAGLQSRGVGACLKHYYANNLEYNRLEQSSDVDERALREIYLKPFEIACEAKPVSAMCAYNRVNGVYASENKKGFRILREEFGFDGAILSDWGAVRDRTASAKAGLDIEFPFDEKNYEKLVADYKAGRIAEAEVDACAQRVLDLIERCKKMSAGKKPNTSVEERLALAQTIAEEGIVLLKNESVLPLKKEQSIAVSGDFAAPSRFGKIAGGGSSMVQWQGEMFHLAEKLQRQQNGAVVYERAFWEKGIDSFGQKPHRALYYAAKSDVSIICVGTGAEIECEERDRASLRLPVWEEEMILRLAERNENTIVVLFAGSAVDTSVWQDAVKGIVLAGFCGERGGDALVRILTGEVNPSGKLAETFPVHLEDTPVFGQFCSPCVAHYGEGLNVGYRYYDRRGGEAFPFGYGLSYSRYEYGGMNVKVQDDFLHVRCMVKNVSERDGREIVQLYLRPFDPFVYRPEKELKGYRKIALKAGEAREVAFILPKDAFAYWSTAVDDWRVDNGLYEILIGASSRDISLRIKVECIDGVFQIV